ncbi:MAG: hypothetical protein ACK4VI_06645 [Alphaproteobacteria bacterium]
MKIKKIAPILACLILVAGCSSKPTVGDQMIIKSQSAQNLGKQWNDGNKMVTSGNKKIEEGQRLINRGNNLVSQGNSEVRRGETLIHESEATFNQKFPQNQIAN